jgi:hypothetical protein
MVWKFHFHFAIDELDFRVQFSNSFGEFIGIHIRHDFEIGQSSPSKAQVSLATIVGKHRKRVPGQAKTISDDTNAPIDGIRSDFGGKGSIQLVLKKILQLVHVGFQLGKENLVLLDGILVKEFEGLFQNG